MEQRMSCGPLSVSLPSNRAPGTRYVVDLQSEASGCTLTVLSLH